MKIAIGLPAYNEEKNIGSIIAKLKKKSYDVIVCDDGSSDNTKIIAEEMGCTVISHNRNRGYGSAIRSLFIKAKEQDYDVTLSISSFDTGEPIYMCTTSEE